LVYPGGGRGNGADLLNDRLEAHEIFVAKIFFAFLKGKAAIFHVFSISKRV
jgi:hypothetical protein